MCICPTRRGTRFLRDQRPMALYPPGRAERMTVIAITGAGPQGMLLR